jgi:hypothetical protein
MNTAPLARFLDRIEELPAPVLIRLPEGERAARQELSESLAAGTHSEIRHAVDRCLRALRSLPAPVLAQLLPMTWLEKWDVQ